MAVSSDYRQASAGLLADGRHLSNRARDEAANYRETYNSPPPLKVRNPPANLYDIY